MLDRATPTPTPRPGVPLLGRVRAGSVTDAKALRARLQQLLQGLERGGLYLDALVGQARHKAIWLVLERPGGGYFGSWEEFCTGPAPHGLGISAEAVDLIIKERSDPRAQARRVLREDAPGRLRLGRQSHRRTADPASAGTKGPKPGNGKDYLLARLARDHRPVLEALERGEYPSVVAAAVAAGFYTPTIQLRPTPESYARSILQHLDAGQIRALIGYLERPETLPSSQARPRNEAWRGNPAWRGGLRPPRSSPSGRPSSHRPQGPEELEAGQPGAA
jgi:hypothetical protein